MDEARVQRWLDDYVEAWRSSDPAAIGALFSEDAQYRYHPWDDPLDGRAAIVGSWLADRDEPGSSRSASQASTIAARPSTGSSHGW